MERVWAKEHLCPTSLEAVRAWRETGTAPFALTGKHVENGKATWEMLIYPYPTKTGWNATNSTFQPVEGKRGGVDKIAERFSPALAESIPSKAAALPPITVGRRYSSALTFSRNGCEMIE